MSSFNSDNLFTQKYNDIFHEIDLYLDNSGDFDSPKRFHINPAAIISLDISDTVNDWIVDGSLTFLYTPETISNYNQTKKTGQNQSTKTGVLDRAASENGQMLQNYQFRGDGFDLLRVMIIPKTAPGNNSIKLDRTSTKWMLSYVFSVFDMEDINDIPALQGAASSFMKCLKLKFHDVRYQMLRTANIEYSTSMPKDSSIKPKFDSDIAKEQGVVYTGDILRDIFNEVLAKPENGGHEEFKINPLLDWDKGKSELFYTSPAQSSAADDIEYVYAHHISTRALQGSPPELELNDLCLLHTDRAKTFGGIESLALTPVTDFFKKAGKGNTSPGELQKEHFFVTSHTEQNSTTALYKAPMGGNGVDVDVKTFKYGQIVSYSFLDMAAVVNSEMFRTTPVYSVDIKKREFNIEFKGNDINSIKKVMSQTYISELYKQGKDESVFLPTIHKNKKDLNVFPTFSLNGNNSVVRQKNGLHNLLYTGLFQNACICFKTYGLTFRESGTFIGIDKTAGSADNDFANKLFGQWFVVRVDHVFEAGAYMNVIYAIKLHRYKELKTKFNGTLSV